MSMRDRMDGFTESPKWSRSTWSAGPGVLCQLRILTLNSASIELTDSIQSAAEKVLRRRAEKVNPRSNDASAVSICSGINVS
jgi:hypothetical protein